MAIKTFARILEILNFSKIICPKKHQKVRPTRWQASVYKIRTVCRSLPKRYIQHFSSVFAEVLISVLPLTQCCFFLRQLLATICPVYEVGLFCPKVRQYLP